MRSGGWVRGFWVLVFGCVCAAAAWSHHGATLSTPRVTAEGVEYLPDPAHVRWLSLGHYPSMADLFWIRAVLYFAREVFQDSPERLKWLSSYIEVVISLDPEFKDIYRWGGAVMVIKSPTVSPEQVFLANAILEEGAKRFPDDHKLPLAAGANCKFYAKTKDPKEREALDACAAKFFRMAAERPGAPYYTALLASQLDDSREACEVLMAMYLREYQDPTTRANLQGRLRDSSCGASTLEEAQRSREAFERLRLRWPGYVSDDLLVHIAPSALNHQGWALTEALDEERLDDGEGQP